MSARPRGAWRVALPRAASVADARTLEILDFPAVRALLAEHCASTLGRELALALEPYGQRTRVQAELEETGEALALLAAGARAPLDGLHDVRAVLGRAARGGVLSGRDLWRVGEAAACVGQLAAFHRSHAERAPRLAEWAGLLGDLSALAGSIRRCLLPDGEVLDQASEALAAARRQARTLEAALREQLEALVRNPALQGVLQEPLVTIRRDRFVLPVRADQRSALPGIIHDASGSGATVFVEPLATVELGNGLAAAQARVAEEVARVLAALSQACAAASEALGRSLEAAAHLDLVWAKAALAAAWDAVAPELSPVPELELPQARHPLLPKAVPVDIRLGQDFDILVLTGPNTGGKTVCLKTAGLLACMAQAGLQLPAGAGARVGIFPRIFCDAGDEQGVAQNLSTFSSHMRAVVAAVRQIVPGALIMLDELGAGTDPGEGSALAMALLEHLLRSGARAIVTTHFSELKAFAYRTPRVENGSMSFDPETLAPTFRLVIGVPGASQALPIARRLGLPQAILERAWQLLRPEERQVESLIAGLREEQQRAAAEALQAEEARRKAEGLRAELQRQREAWDVERSAMRAAAEAEAEAIVQQARAKVDGVLRELRRLVESAQQGDAAGAALVARAEALRGELRRAPVPDAPAVHRALHAGQVVRIRSLGRQGVLLAAPAEGVATVQAGALRLTVPTAELEPAWAPLPDGEPAPRGQARPQPVPAAARAPSAWLPTVPTECDLRGMRVEEALARVDKLLDDAVLAGVGEIRLIHGKGTGALRQAVAEMLRGHPQVAGFRLGGAGEGGVGATVVQVRL